MVVIHVKRTETDQFLYECTTKDSNDAVTRDIATIWNLREKVGHLSAGCEELAKHGRMKKEAERGIDEVLERDGTRIEKGPHYAADPLGVRDGNAPPPATAEIIRRTCEDAKGVVSKAAFAAGTALTVGALTEKIALMRGAVTMAFPMGLPEWDTLRILFEETDDGVLRELMGNDYMDPATAGLWWAGKEFFRDQTVGDRVGRNEKTKIVARLQRPGGGAPTREPGVSEEERKAMMAYYFKKTEEEKALAEDRDDSYLAAAWADPRALKSQLLGGGAVSWKPSAAGGAGGRR